MADYPPFMNAYGLIPKILEKVKQAKTPDRFTQDFLATKLGFPGGSAKAFLSFAKRIGLISSDGSPTEIYKSFRNPDQSKSAMAKAIRHGYPEVFSRNEYAYELEPKKLEGLIMEITGLEKGNTTLKSIASSFLALKELADFEGKEETTKDKGKGAGKDTPPPPLLKDDDLALNLSYTINLVLPKTDDIAVFNAIFKSLRENLLRK